MKKHVICTQGCNAFISTGEIENRETDHRLSCSDQLLLQEANEGWFTGMLVTHRGIVTTQVWMRSGALECLIRGGYVTENVADASPHDFLDPHVQFDPRFPYEVVVGESDVYGKTLSPLDRMLYTDDPDRPAFFSVHAPHDGEPILAKGWTGKIPMHHSIDPYWEGFRFKRLCQLFK